MIKLYGLVAVAMFVAMLGGGAYFYYSSTQNHIAALVENNATLQSNVAVVELANDQNLDTIDSLQQAYVRVQQDYTELETRFQIIRSQNSELRERLGRHDLAALAAAKPRLVERTINTASSNALRCFELISGSQLTDKERSATSEKSFNSECPWLWPGNNP